MKCIYDATMNYDSGQGGLKIFIPTQKGYVNYNFVHTYKESRNADMWRLTVVNLADKDGNIVKQITKNGAEWEMAVRLQERCDFIGGYAHGDEKYTNLVLYIDDKEQNITAINEYTCFDEIKIVMDSIGYDPADSEVEALKHHKEYIINEEGITLHQTVEWLHDYPLRANSFLAMMPPLKHSLTDQDDVITDTYYTDVNCEPMKLEKNAELSITQEGVREVCVFGEASGISFTMSKADYNPSCSGGNVLILSDNGGLNYNKMYFPFAGEGTVSKGDVWTATTNYKIEWK